METIRERGAANVVFATGASQLELLEHLVRDPRIDWSRITGFHLDEYVGLPATHPASFRRYLRERLVDRVGLAAFHYVDGEADPAAECRRLGRLLEDHPVDLAFVGIGENGHLAFNDPPADLDTEEPFLLVTLDEACRAQQVREGWFADTAAVPPRALSMSIHRILQARTILGTVPGARKAEAVRAALLDPIGPDVPAASLRRHPAVWLYLDEASAARLDAAASDPARDDTPG